MKKEDGQRIVEWRGMGLDEEPVRIIRSREYEGSILREMQNSEDDWEKYIDRDRKLGANRERAVEHKAVAEG